jgi:hypothetical protein
MEQGEITCEFGRTYIAEMGRRQSTRSNKQKYNLKEWHSEKSKSALHACKEAYKFDWTRATHFICTNVWVNH